METLTKEAINKMLAEIKDLMPSKQEQNMFSFSGIPIISNPHIPDLVPVIQLSEKVTVSDEFREKCNQYYIDMFGYHSPIMWKTQYGFHAGPAFVSALTIGAVA